MITIGAFAAVMGSWLCDSWIMGLVFGLVSGALVGLFYGLFVIRFHSDEFIIGVALNISELGATKDMIDGIADATFLLEGGYKVLKREEVVAILKESL